MGDVDAEPPTGLRRPDPFQEVAAEVRPGDAEDRDLVVRTLAGERRAFGELVRRHQRAVFGIALRTTGDRQVAQDIAQETFLRAYRALGRFDVARPFSPWLYRIATNQSLKWVQRRRVPTVPLAEHAEVGPQLADPLAQPEDAIVARERYARLWAAVAALPPDFREAVLLRHAEGLTYRQIADRMDISLANAKSRLFRARRQLREVLAAESES